METTKKAGRPKLKDDEKQECRVMIRFTKEVYDHIKQLAKQQHKPISTYIKSILSERVNNN